MKQIIIGLTIGVLSMLVYNQYTKPIESASEIKGSQIIQEQLKNVSKLVVTEGFFSDVITYKDVKSLYMDLLSAEKKAVVLVRAKATISYDLHQLEFNVDELNKIIMVSNIPEPELQINPKLTYYDLQQEYLNPFNASDYNKISNLVNKRLKNQIYASEFVSNSKNRLLSELHGLFGNTPLKGWTIISIEEPYKNMLFLDE